MNAGHTEKNINADVLVIGGGIAGIFAAIKAREQGADVILADKSHIGNTSGAHFAEGDIIFFRENRGHVVDEWVQAITESSEYLNNRDWDELVLRAAEARYNDLVSWGVEFYKEDGETYISTMNREDKSAWADIHMSHMKYMPTLREKALEKGVRLMDRIMISDLIRQNNEVVGAIGFHTTSGELHIFNTGAVIIATGGVGQLKASGSDIHQYTGDGDAMAYRAGAEITGKEFIFWFSAPRDMYKQQMDQLKKQKGKSPEISDIMERFPFVSIQSGFPFPNMNAEGEPILLAPWEVHCGKGPIYADLSMAPPGDEERIKRFFRRAGTAEIEKLGLDPFKTQKLVIPAGRGGDQLFGGACGIWPADDSCATNVPGLYVAGNSCGSRGGGSRYAGPGFGLIHAMETGTRAASSAFKYASAKGTSKIGGEEFDKIKNTVCAPVERNGGFSPGWVTHVLQGMVTPYFITQIKHKDRMEPALQLVEFLNSHIVPKLWAKDAHEWRMAQETRNMVVNSEMVLRASLFRTESRGSHFREDYPRRDDPDWLAWVKLREEDGKMKAVKEPIPEKWWPDMSKSYEERYPTMMPME